MENTKFKAGDIVELYNRKGKMVVSICTENQVVAFDETLNKYETLHINQVVPWRGEMYDELFSVLVTAMEKTFMRTSSNSERPLYLTRDLFDAGMRTDFSLGQKINEALNNAVMSEMVIKAIQVAMTTSGSIALAIQAKDYGDPHKFPGTVMTTTAPATGLATLSDVELIELVVHVAEKISQHKGFEVKYRDKKLISRVKWWDTNLSSRAKNVWATAIDVVDLCRKSECRDAIDEYLDVPVVDDDKDDDF